MNDYVITLQSLNDLIMEKEIHHTMRIRESDSTKTNKALFDKFCIAMHSEVEDIK